MSARLGTFRVSLLPGIAHSEDTLRILDNKMPTSYLVREAILRKAEKHNFQPNEIEKQEYLTHQQWQIFLNAQRNSRSIDYIYYLAFYWLKSLPRFQYASSGLLVREALTEYQD